MQIGFLLLCGGHSSRMGTPKALLQAGGTTLLDIVSTAGQSFNERIFSVNDPSIPTPEGYLRLADILPGQGPVSGLHAALATCRSDALVVAPCDAPSYSKALACYLASALPAGADALVLHDAAGRIHPLMGIYHKRCLPVFTSALQSGHSGVMHALENIPHIIAAPPAVIGDEVFRNINTPEEFSAWKAGFGSSGEDHV